jgi:hypothetical protein
LYTIAEVHEQIASLLANPVRGGMCGDAENVYPAVGVLNDRKAVQSREEHSIAMEEVTRQNPARLGTQKVSIHGSG